MEKELKQILLGTINPDQKIRENSEAYLKQIEKNPEIIEFIEKIIAKDENPQIRQISSVYFPMRLEAEWKNKQFSQYVSKIESTILTSILMAQETYIRNAYIKLLTIIIENSNTETIESLTRHSLLFLKSENMDERVPALELYLSFFNCESTGAGIGKYLNIIFSGENDIFLNSMMETIRNENIVQLNMYVEFLSKVFVYYKVPSYLTETDALVKIYKALMEVARCNWGCVFNDVNKNTQVQGRILDIENEKSLLRRNLSAYFYGITYKGLKKYSTSGGVVKWIKNIEILDEIIQLFDMYIPICMEQEIPDQEILIDICGFYSLMSENKFTRNIMKQKYLFLIQKLIVPLKSYCGSIEDSFEYDPVKYLQEKYNYPGYEVSDKATVLFQDIMRVSKELKKDIVELMIRYIEECDISDAMKYKYGVLGLLCGIQRSIEAVLGDDGYNKFVVKYIYGNLLSKFPFIVSQALQYLSQSDHNNVPADDTRMACSIVSGMIGIENEILSAEAVLAMKFFIGNKYIQKDLEKQIPVLLDQTLKYTKMYNVDPFSQLCDTIIDSYTEQISVHAPHYTRNICASVLCELEKPNCGYNMTVSGYISTILNLLTAVDEKQNIVDEMYSSCEEIVKRIFLKRLEDFYMEGVEIMNAFIFAKKQITTGMMEMFKIVLSMPGEEMIIYPSEIADFVDNYLSFSKGALFTSDSAIAGYNREMYPRNIDLVKKVVDVFFPQTTIGKNQKTEGYDEYFDEESFIDEEYIVAFKVFESLMLNAGREALQTAPKDVIEILVRIVGKYDMLRKSEGSLFVHSVNAIMNFFMVSPQTVLQTAGDFVVQMIEDMRSQKKMFKRVHDKKILALFVGTFYNISKDMIAHMGIHPNIESLNEIFIWAISSLPAAIKKRNTLKRREEENDSNEDECESEYDSCDVSIEEDSLEEDIFFETVLDGVSIYNYARNLLNAPVEATVGSSAIQRLNGEQIQILMDVLNIQQDEQIV